jgi:hypothetical protein
MNYLEKRWKELSEDLIIRALAEYNVVISDKNLLKLREIYDKVNILNKDLFTDYFIYKLKEKNGYIIFKWYHFAYEQNILYFEDFKNYNNKDYKYNTYYYNKKPFKTFEEIPIGEKIIKFHNIETDILKKTLPKITFEEFLNRSKINFSNSHDIINTFGYNNSDLNSLFNQLNHKKINNLLKEYKNIEKLKNIRKYINYNFNLYLILDVLEYKIKNTQLRIAYVAELDTKSDQSYISSIRFIIVNPKSYTYNYIDKNRWFTNCNNEYYFFETLKSINETEDLQIILNNYTSFLRSIGISDLNQRIINDDIIISSRNKKLLQEKKQERERKINELKNKKFKEKLDKINNEDGYFEKNGIKFYLHKIEYDNIILDTNQCINYKHYLEDKDIDKITDFNSILEKSLKSIGVLFTTYRNKLKYTHTFNIFNNRIINESLLDKKQFKFKLEGKEIILEKKGNFYYINDYRINKHEIPDVLLQIICYQTLEKFNKFLEIVSKCSLKFHNAITNNLKKSLSSYSSKGFTIELKLQRKKNLNYLVVGKNKYKIKDTNTLIDKQPYNKVELIKLLLNTIHLDYTEIPTILADGEKRYKEAIKKSEELLNKAIKTLGAIKKEYRIDGTNYNGYEIKGKSGIKYFVIEPSSSNSGFKIYKVLPNNNFDYVCIINKSNKGHIGKDALVSRLYALANDTLVAKDIYTLKV